MTSDYSLHDLCSGEDLEAIRRLLALGEDPNVRNPSGQTPLHCAALHNRSEVIRALHAAGADLEAKDGFGDTPIHYAITFRGNRSLDLLIELGANIAAQTSNNETAMMLAAKRGNFAAVESLEAAYQAKAAARASFRNRTSHSR